MNDQNRSLEEVYKIAGGELSKVLDVYFPKEEERVNWFYSSNKRLGKSPHDFCKEGKQGELVDILICLAQGNIGG